MKTMHLSVGLSVLLVGCSTTMENWYRDPHFAKHQEAMNNLEHQYLHKEMSYTEYQQKKKELEDQYSYEVKMREEKIHND